MQLIIGVFLIKIMGEKNMKDSNSKVKSIFIIIICIAAIITVIVIQRIEKNESKKNIEDVISSLEVSEGNLINNNQNIEITNDNDQEKLEENTMPDPDMEYTSDDEQIGGGYLPPDVYSHAVYFNEEAYDLIKDLPLFITDVIYIKLSDYIDKYIPADRKVGSDIGIEGQMTLLKDTFNIDKENNVCSFTCDLHNDYLLYVRIDLVSGEYTITDNFGFK